MKWTQLSCHDFKGNHVRLQLFALAYGLGNFLRGPVLPSSIQYSRLPTLQEKLITSRSRIGHDAEITRCSR